MGSPFSKRPKLDEKGNVVPPSPYKTNNNNNNKVNDDHTTKRDDSTACNNNNNNNNINNNNNAKSESTRPPLAATAATNTSDPPALDVLPVPAVALSRVDNTAGNASSSNTNNCVTSQKDDAEKEQQQKQQQQQQLLDEEAEDEEAEDEEADDAVVPLPSLKVNVAGAARTMVGAETERKTTKLAKFADIASPVESAPYLLVSGIIPAESSDILQEHNVQTIINCAPDVVTNPSSTDFAIHRWWLSDDKAERIDPFFFRALDIIERVRCQFQQSDSTSSKGGKLLIHCYQGVSRSVSLIVAYIMWRDRLTYHDALDIVRRTRGIARPNIGFQCQLTLWRSLYLEASKGPLDAARLYRAVRQRGGSRDEHVLSLCVGSGTAAYAAAVPSLDLLQGTGVYVLHVPLPPLLQAATEDSSEKKEQCVSPSSTAATSVVLLWSGDAAPVIDDASAMVGSSGSSSLLLRDIIGDVRLMLKYSLRFVPEGEQVGAVDIKCLRERDAQLLHDVDGVSVANDTHVDLFWTTMGASSVLEGEESVRQQQLPITKSEGIIKEQRQIQQGEGVPMPSSSSPSASSSSSSSGLASAESGVNAGSNGNASRDEPSFPTLYLRTDESTYEHLSTYDDDDLDSASVIVLRASQNLIYICIGTDLDSTMNGIFEKNNEDVCTYMWKDYTQGLFGAPCVEDREERDLGNSDTKLIVVREGASVEWNEFMDAFAEGL